MNFKPCSLVKIQTFKSLAQAEMEIGCDDFNPDGVVKLATWTDTSTEGLEQFAGWYQELPDGTFWAICNNEDQIFTREGACLDWLSQRLDRP